MPAIKAIEQAEFGGVDSRSNPVNMPTKRWLRCRNWIPRPDGHLELREGYMVRVYAQAGSTDAAYSLTPYTVAVPNSYVTPPPPQDQRGYSPVTGVYPPISPVLNNGTRTALWWQKGVPAQATTQISSVACSIQSAGVPELAIYQVLSTANFVLGATVIVEGVNSGPTTPPGFFDGTYPIQAIGPGTITLDLGLSPARRKRRQAPRLVPLPPPVRPPVPTPVPQANFSVSPTSISFGNIPANTPTSVTVTITYNNAAVGNIGTIETAGFAGNSFTENLPLPTNLTNGQSVTFQVSINQPAGSYSDTLTITTLLPSTISIPITATVVASSGGGGGTPTPGVGNITVSPAQVTFPNTTVGVATSTEPVVTITNNTTGDVTFSNPVLSNPDFSIIYPGGLNYFPISVPAGGYLSFQVSATPSAAGTDSGTLTITTNDTAMPQLVLTMSLLATLPGQSGYPENYSGTGGTMVAVIATPGPPQPLLLPLTTAGDTVFLPGTFIMKGMPISSTAPWHYALGKDGFLYMHNGVDAKFFDGVCFRDIGLPVLTIPQVADISVATGLQAPTVAQADSVLLTFVNASPNVNANWENVAGSEVYMAYFDTATNTLLPVNEPLGGTSIPAGGQSSLTVTSGTMGVYSGMQSGPPFSTSAQAHAGDNAISIYGNGLSGTLPLHTPFTIAGDPTVYYSNGPFNAGQGGFPANWVGTAIFVAHGTGFVFGTLVNTPALGAVITFQGTVAPNQVLQLTNLPVGTPSTVVTLLAIKPANAAGAKFMVTNTSGIVITLSAQDATTVLATVPGGVGSLAVGDVIALYQEPQVGTTPPTFASNGPFTVTSVTATSFTFTVPNASQYAGATVAYQQLVVLPHGTTSYTFDIPSWPPTLLQGQGVNSGVDPFTGNGVILLPYADQSSPLLIPASAIGGDQPGYQFFASIYNPLTGHVGNRVQVGVRIANSGDSEFIVSGLPDFTQPSSEIQWSQQQNKIPTVPLLTSDPEWRILIGRTGDGGEVPYACIDPQGNWICTTSPSQSSITVAGSQVDSNSELPYDNFPPPRTNVLPHTQESFANFWREGDRLCGVLKQSPFVYRSGSELDATTGIFVGDPAQAWDPAKIETFPTAEDIIAGFGYMQESWCYTRNDVAQLSELSGEVTWNGPYNYGIAGSFAFDKGWQSLPFWVSHDRQLVTMLPGGDGPISVSTEYERALLSKIGDEFDASGNPLMYMQQTEVVYFRDPDRLIDCLRIKCVDNTGAPFTVIHDFNLRDDSSPYGQGYEEIYLGPLASDYQQVYIRDSMALSRVWAAAGDGQIYQFYTGGLDNVDYADGTQGEAYTADAIQLRYLGGERTAARTLEWYGDNAITWYIYENMLNVDPDSNYWVNVTFDMRPFPGDAQAAHYIADIQRPEMIHCYLWASLTAHPADTPEPLTPMILNDPPHLPLEEYGRLYLAAPWLGTSRGR